MGEKNTFRSCNHQQSRQPAVLVNLGLMLMTSIVRSWSELSLFLFFDEVRGQSISMSEWLTKTPSSLGFCFFLLPFIASITMIVTPSFSSWPFFYASGDYMTAYISYIDSQLEKISAKWFVFFYLLDINEQWRAPDCQTIEKFSHWRKWQRKMSWEGLLFFLSWKGRNHDLIFLVS